MFEGAPTPNKLTVNEDILLPARYREDYMIPAIGIRTRDSSNRAPELGNPPRKRPPTAIVYPSEPNYGKAHERYSTEVPPV